MANAVVDANVVLRVLTDEPRPLADRATVLLAEAARRGIGAALVPLTIAEIFYVLEKVYRRPRAEVIDGLIELIDADLFVIVERPVVLQALTWCRDRSGLDFPDAYVAAVAAAQNASVFSFDADLRRLPGVRVVSDAREL